MPHSTATSGCKGWSAGPYDIRTMCRVCWKGRNRATERDDDWIIIDQQAAAVSAVSYHAVTYAPPPATRPPCIHLGPIIEPAATVGCDRHVYDCAVHDRCKAYNWQSTPLACCDGCVDYQGPAAPDGITIAVTHWHRPAALNRLLASISKHLPGVPVETEDTGGNLSAGRNRLYARVRTPFLLVCEEDFVMIPGTQDGIRNALSILNADPDMQGVGGAVNEGPRGRVVWGHNFYMQGSVCRITPSKRPLKRIGQLTYRPCDLVLNWGVFRTDLFQRVKWDEDFAITEHKEFFYRASKAGNQFAFYSGLKCDHLRDRPNATYQRGRGRNFHHLVKPKHGFTFENSV